MRPITDRPQSEVIRAFFTSLQTRYCTRKERCSAIPLYSYPNVHEFNRAEHQECDPTLHLWKLILIMESQYYVVEYVGLKPANTLL